MSESHKAIHDWIYYHIDKNLFDNYLDTGESW